MWDVIVTHLFLFGDSRTAPALCKCQRNITVASGKRPLIMRSGVDSTNPHKRIWSYFKNSDVHTIPIWTTQYISKVQYLHWSHKAKRT